MEEKKIMDPKDLEKVSGGIETAFHGNTPVCPVCGQPNIRKLSGDEYTDTYQCDCCGMMSTHTKKARPIAKPLHMEVRCGICGMNDQWRIIRTEAGLDLIECGYCRTRISVPSETD